LVDYAPVTRERLEERLEEVRLRIGRAAEHAGRDPEGVEILPVTKGHAFALIREVAHVGLARIGENRVDEAEEKHAALGGKEGIAWHMIGHLQRNKAAGATRLFDVIESVDSVRLARRLSLMAERSERAELEVLIEVNTSGEASKSGFEVDDLVENVREICDLPRLKVCGLMTMAPFTSDTGALRATFRDARKLFERYGDEIEKFEPITLSMGMSNDFEIAVEEGSTRVRLGTVLLGERPQP
jgi:pyridoxal phosphate enzyme (YggS family)